jgi:F-type H+-transporting ATPase subunit gamma
MLCVAGLRAAARLETAGHDAARLFTLPGSVEGLADTARSVVIEIDRWQREEGVRTIHVLHNRRGRLSRAEPRSAQLLPVPGDDLDRLARTPWPGRSLPAFTMAPETLLSWLIQQRVFLGVYRGLAESLASEHAARLAAMQAADRNIDERREEIEATYRQKRQETITRELLDVVAGFEAASSEDATG